MTRAFRLCAALLALAAPASAQPKRATLADSAPRLRAPDHGPAGRGIAEPERLATGPRIALTFDDLPAHGPLPTGTTRRSIARAIVAALRRHGVKRAHGFVTGSFGADDPMSARVLSAWRAAGYSLGNHSFSHTNLDLVDVVAYTADIIRNEAVIAPLMTGEDWHWFRYPFLSEGSSPARHAAVRRFLADHGYKVASVTLNFNDWAYSAPYARCVAQGDAAAITVLEQAYLGAAQADFTNTRAHARQQTGRDLPYVLLLHAGAFTAHMLPRLLALYEAGQARFVSLAEAEADPFYAGDTGGAATGAAISLAGPPPTDGAPGAPPDISALCP